MILTIEQDGDGTEEAKISPAPWLMTEELDGPDSIAELSVAVLKEE